MAITKLVSDSLGAGVGGNLVKLTSSTDVSGASSFSIDGFFTSSYDIYELHIYDIHLDTTISNTLRCRVRSSNADLTTSIYEYSGYSSRRGTTNSLDGAGNVADDAFKFNDWNRPNDDTSNRTLSGYVRIHNPLSTTFDKNFLFEFQSRHESVAYYVSEQYGGTVVTTNALSGITFYTNNGANFDAGQYILYGVTK